VQSALAAGRGADHSSRGVAGRGAMNNWTKSILISIGLTILLNAILWMSGCSVITLKM
jgi:hypothetical protein